MKIAGIAVVLAAALGAAPAVEGRQLDSRWAPWLGCWQLSREPVRVCVAAADDGRGVTLKTYVDNAAAEPRGAVLEQTLVADGAPHPVAEAECRGFQSAQWSATGERLFARAELTCSDGASREVSGLSMITGDGVWIDIQGIEIAGRESIRVRRYERSAADGAASGRVRLRPDATYGRLAGSAPRLTAAALTTDDVTEAAGRVSARVVEAALVETRAGFTLKSDVLRRLQRAGVAPGIIDTMVALSYPQHFIVERPDSQASAASAPVGFGDLDSPWSAAWSSPYYDTYWSPFWSPYFYAPFGYAYWASYGGYFPYGGYGPGTGFVAIDPSGRGDGGDSRVINGVGYTRIREREVVERGGGDATTSSGGSSSGGASVPMGGTSGVSPGGYSGGSSGGDGGGRTAQPR